MRVSEYIAHVFKLIVISYHNDLHPGALTIGLPSHMTSFAITLGKVQYSTVNLSYISAKCMMAILMLHYYAANKHWLHGVTYPVELYYDRYTSIHVCTEWFGYRVRS